jgi:sugar lactone lactonase YvrE
VTGHNEAKHAQAATISLFATGFNNPRGLEWGPDGNLYVAEGGLGGSDSTVGQCTQVDPPIGPYTGSTNDPVKGGRISMVTPAGVRTTLASGLPSSMTTAQTGNLTSGVSDVAFVGSQMYALLSGAGCSHGVATVPNGVIRVASNGSWTMIANLSEFIQDNPVRNPGLDFEPDGTFYSMVSVGGTLYVAEPNQGSIERVTTSGAISRLVDVSASQGHVVPTALAHHGVLYVGNLGTFGPEDQAGDQHVYQVTPNGHLKIKSTGVEKVLGLAFVGGKEYALEMSTAGGGPVPGTGALVRVQAGHVTETIASGMTFPTGLTVGPDGAFYVSNQGFGFPAGQGQVLRITTG